MVKVCTSACARLARTASMNIHTGGIITRDNNGSFMVKIDKSMNQRLARSGSDYGSLQDQTLHTRTNGAVRIFRPFSQCSLRFSQFSATREIYVSTISLTYAYGARFLNGRLALITSSLTLRFERGRGWPSLTSVGAHRSTGCGLQQARYNCGGLDREIVDRWRGA